METHDLATSLGTDGVLHLHRLQDQERLPLLDLLPHLTIQAHDDTGHIGTQLLRPLGSYGRYGPRQQLPLVHDVHLDALASDQDLVAPTSLVEAEIMTGSIHEEMQLVTTSSSCSIHAKDMGFLIVLLGSPQMNVQAVLSLLEADLATKGHISLADARVETHV